MGWSCELWFQMKDFIVGFPPQGSGCKPAFQSQVPRQFGGPKTSDRGLRQAQGFWPSAKLLLMCRHLLVQCRVVSPLLGSKVALEMLKRRPRAPNVETNAADRRRVNEVKLDRRHAKTWLKKKKLKKVWLDFAALWRRIRELHARQTAEGGTFVRRRPPSLNSLFGGTSCLEKFWNKFSNVSKNILDSKHNNLLLFVCLFLLHVTVYLQMRTCLVAVVSALLLELCSPTLQSDARQSNDGKSWI